MLASILSGLAAMLILWRGLQQAASFNAQAWKGHAVQFVAVAAGSVLITVGAVFLALGWPPAVPLLLTGIALRAVFDRRKT